MQPKFIHLNLHTEYSIVDGIVRIAPLVDKCVAEKMPAMAITDFCNFFGLVKFYQAAIKLGVKPIVGVEVLVASATEPTNSLGNLVLLCQNSIGYGNVTRLISRAYLEGQDSGKPMVMLEWLQGNTEEIIALSGGMSGDVGAALLAQNDALATELIANWKQLFPQRFYLEISRTGRADEERYIAAALELAQRAEVPVVATNCVRFLHSEDFEAHEARVCIHEGYVLEDSKRPRQYTAQQYLRTEEEMIDLFADIPGATENSVEIAKRCNLELHLGEAFLPNFPTPNNLKIDDFFAEQAKQGLIARHTPEDKKNIYNERLEHELKVINQMGFAGYFLIVADFIRWAKENGIPVGPGRGSGAGSLVAYALRITDLDPIEHELLFERFLNPERVSMPDFDIDFCMEGRDRVIEYVAERYGRESVSQIITFGTMAARAVVRDVGRVLGHPYGYVDQIAKLIPFELGITLERALQEEDRLEELYKNDEEARTLIDLAQKLEGVTRNAGKHAGGVVISPSLLTDFTPLYCEAGGANLITQFDKGDVEAVGLVKFDFLGLRTLTIINWATQTINAARSKKSEELLDIAKIPLDDEATFDLLKSCATVAVFQLESRGMRDLIKRLQPDCFDDIVALVALFRPGPLQSGMVDDYIERKHGRAVVRYPHPELEPILRPTYGVILYQEQVMQIAQVLAGYTLGSADLLRRAMGKKKPEEMAKHRAIFMEGAVKRGVDKHVANSIFDLMEKFAGYGFNKSHSAGYALIAYQTAWLKAHYPAEFMAAVLSSDMDNTDKVVMFIRECEKLKLKIIPPDINHSQYKFTVGKTGEIIFGLGAIKGAGAAALDNIIAKRTECSAFNSLFDLCTKVDSRKVNKRVLEAAIYAGALDSIHGNRASIYASMPLALRAAEQFTRHKEQGQGDLFGDLTPDDESDFAYVDVPEWSDEQKLNHEAETLGFYLSGHPIAKYEQELEQFTTAKIADLHPTTNSVVVIAGFVSTIKMITTKSNKRMAILTLEDRSSRIDVTVFSDAYTTYRDVLIKGNLLVVEGDVSVDSFTDSYRVQARRIFDLNNARETYAKFLLLDLSSEVADGDFMQKLCVILQHHIGGPCPVCVSYNNKDASSRLLLGEEWQIHPTEGLLLELQHFFGSDRVHLEY